MKFKKMIKIVIFLPSLGVGGAEISLTRIALNLTDNKKTEVLLVVAKNLEKKRDKFTQEYKYYISRI